LTVALLWLAVALRRTSMLLRWLTILLLRRLTVLLLRRLAVLLLRLATLVVVTIRYTTVSRSSATRCSVRVTVGRLRRRLGRLGGLILGLVVVVEQLLHLLLEEVHIYNMLRSAS
jgi:hypothetical protein